MDKLLFALGLFLLYIAAFLGFVWVFNYCAIWWSHTQSYWAMFWMITIFIVVFQSSNRSKD